MAKSLQIQVWRAVWLACAASKASSICTIPVAVSPAHSIASAGRRSSPSSVRYAALTQRLVLDRHHLVIGQMCLVLPSKAAAADAFAEGLRETMTPLAGRTMRPIAKALDEAGIKTARRVAAIAASHAPARSARPAIGRDGASNFGHESRSESAREVFPQSAGCFLSC